jgi:hypothetical protein
MATMTSLEARGVGVPKSLSISEYPRLFVLGGGTAGEGTDLTRERQATVVKGSDETPQ